MNVLVCVKRVPQTGGRIVLTADGMAIDTRFLGATISPHEECGVEEAVRPEACCLKRGGGLRRDPPLAACMRPVLAVDALRGAGPQKDLSAVGHGGVRIQVDAVFDQDARADPRAS